MEPHREVLLRAADIIAERGHHKGNYEDKTTGAVCALGAISVAATGNAQYNDDRSVLSEKAANLLAFQLGPTGAGHVPDWNDAESTSAEDVILTLKRAAQ